MCRFHSNVKKKFVFPCFELLITQFFSASVNLIFIYAIRADCTLQYGNKSIQVKLKFNFSFLYLLMFHKLMCHLASSQLNVLIF